MIGNIDKLIDVPDDESVSSHVFPRMLLSTTSSHSIAKWFNFDEAVPDFDPFCFSKSYFHIIACYPIRK